MRRVTEIESLYIDFDAFFANAEKQLCPELRGRPVGIAPLASRHTKLIACCYQAKAMGVTRGTSVQEARARCPDIVLRLARHDEYVKLHHRILEEINRHVPVHKVWSVDEMECALIGTEQLESAALAGRIREGLRTAIGAWVTPSIGLAPNQFLAKVAAEMDKPNGFVMLHPEDLPGPLFDLSLRDFPGISKGMLIRLGKAGVSNVEDLWQLPPKHMRQIWHSVEGERFWAQLHGFAVARPETVRRMFGHGRILAKDWRTPEKARDCLRLLTAKAARRLRREGYMSSALAISFGHATGQRWHAEQHFFPARDDRTFLNTACALFDAGIRQSGARRLKKVSVMLHRLSKSGDISADLFEQDTQRSERWRWEKVTDAMDALNTRYKTCSVSLGPRYQPPGGYAGAKIAFGRVPSLEDFG